MKRFLLDTNICLAFVRGHEIYKQVETDLSLNDTNSITIISVVTNAELLSLGKRKGWGNQKLAKLNNSDTELIEAYYTIDAFSQGDLEGRSLKSSGKNDLWIAATALVANAELITMDNDFDHLNEEFLIVHKY